MPNDRQFDLYQRDGRHRISKHRDPVADRDSNDGHTRLGTYSGEDLHRGLEDHQAAYNFLVLENDEGEMYLDRADNLNGWTGNGCDQYPSATLFESETEAQAYIDKHQKKG